MKMDNYQRVGYKEYDGSGKLEIIYNYKNNNLEGYYK